MDLSLEQCYGIRGYTNFMASYSVFSKHKQHKKCKKFGSASGGTDVNFGY